MAELRVVRDDGDDGPSTPDTPDPADLTITDTTLTFTGALGPLAIDGKTSGLKVTFFIDPSNPVTHREFAVLRHRFLSVTIAPQTRTGQAASPSVDPVAEAVQARRIERMVDGWVTGSVDDMGDMNGADLDGG